MVYRTAPFSMTLNEPYLECCTQERER